MTGPILFAFNIIKSTKPGLMILQYKVQISLLHPMNLNMCIRYIHSAFLRMCWYFILARYVIHRIVYHSCIALKRIRLFLRKEPIDFFKLLNRYANVFFGLYVRKNWCPIIVYTFNKTAMWLSLHWYSIAKSDWKSTIILCLQILISTYSIKIFVTFSNL